MCTPFSFPPRTCGQRLFLFWCFTMHQVMVSMHLVTQTPENACVQVSTLQQINDCILDLLTKKWTDQTLEEHIFSQNLTGRNPSNEAHRHTQKKIRKRCSYGHSHVISPPSKQFPQQTLTVLGGAGPMGGWGAWLPGLLCWRGTRRELRLVFCVTFFSRLSSSSTMELIMLAKVRRLISCEPLLGSLYEATGCREEGRKERSLAVKKYRRKNL